MLGRSYQRRKERSVESDKTTNKEGEPMEVENDLFHQYSSACLLHKNQRFIVIHNAMECPVCKITNIHEDEKKRWESSQNQYLQTASEVRDEMRDKIMDQVRQFLTRFI